MLSVQCASSLISWLPDRHAAMLHRHARYCRPRHTALSVSPHAGPATHLSVVKRRVQRVFVKRAPCQYLSSRAATAVVAQAWVVSHRRAYKHLAHARILDLCK